MIYVECKPDKTLVIVLTNKTPDEIFHFGGKSEIFRRMQRERNVIGIVDEDPSAPTHPYIRNLNLENQKYSLKLYLDKPRANKLIVICPRLEDWILEIAKQENINLSDFKIPDNPSEFHSTVNFNITNFQKLLHKLKETENKRLLALKEFILK
jgi:hypothetical protein